MSRPCRARFAALWLSTALIPMQAWAQGNGFVGIYADAGATSPCTTVLAGTGAILYVVASLEGTTAGGVVGAEFRIEVSNPEGWFFSFSATQGTTAIGNVLDTDPGNPNDGTGLTMAFSTCQSGSAQILLGTIGAFNSSGDPTSLSVKRHSTPSNPDYSCPLFVLCNGPSYSKSCMTSGASAACNLSKPSVASVYDPAVFVAGLNGQTMGGGESPGDPLPMPDDVFTRNNPILYYTAAEPDIVGLDGNAKAIATVAAETTWVADWNFDGAGGGCSFSSAGWSAKDNLVRNDSPSYWRINSNHAGQGTIVNKAAEIAVENCWTLTGYGNDWDQGVRLKYKGTGSTLTFDFLSEGEVDPGFGGLDYMTVELDSAGTSNSRVHYEGFGSHRRPESFRTVLYTERYAPAY